MEHTHKRTLTHVSALFSLQNSRVATSRHVTRHCTKVPQSLKITEQHTHKLTQRETELFFLEIQTWKKVDEKKKKILVSKTNNHTLRKKKSLTSVIQLDWQPFEKKRKKTICCSTHHNCTTIKTPLSPCHNGSKPIGNVVIGCFVAGKA